MQINVPPFSAPIRRALLSVSDKTGIIEFAHALQQLGIEILSTGGTAKLLKQHNIDVLDVAEHTGFPEIMDGRVKTLHPKIHGGLLGRRDIDAEVMQQQQIAPIDLVAVNLYPFTDTISKPDCDFAMAIENIDIGGPTMLRSAAKNHAAVTVIVDHNDYPKIIDELQQQQGMTSAATRFELARKTFAHTAKYDAAISNYLGSLSDESQFPTTYTEQFTKRDDLRYGENPHQQAAFYVEAATPSACIASATQCQGKALSYNNIADADAALECVKALPNDRPACCIVKHANPCGVAIADTQLTAYEKAYSTDATSAFGGIIAFNSTLTAETVEQILNKQFVEVIIAPDISTNAKHLLATKKNIRALSCGQWQTTNAVSLDYKRVTGGLLIQDNDQGNISLDDMQVVTKQQPSQQQLNDLLFAWRVVKFVKSNAIVYANDQMTVGIGAGQMSRVISAEIAGMKAKQAQLNVNGAVMASDAFFPFRDAIDAAAKAGIKAIIQPGGSMRDAEVIAAADESGIAMAFTGMRHFRH